jgi:phospholipid transport system transporter-binding protein
MSFRVVDGQTWAVSGELNFASANALLRNAQALSAANGWPRTVDLQEVTRSDSAGLALLLELLRLAGHPLAFHNPPAQLSHIAQLSGLSEILR